MPLEDLYPIPSYSNDYRPNIPKYMAHAPSKWTGMTSNQQEAVTYVKYGLIRYRRQENDTVPNSDDATNTNLRVRVKDIPLDLI